MVSTIKDAVALVRTICLLPGNASFREDAEQGLREAIANHDTPALYDWLMTGFSFQGISDRIAEDYIDRHGNSTWQAIETALGHHRCSCPKLEGFDAYRQCGYRKTARTCRNPADLPDCPVPKLPLRKGDLNQLAFSLYLFLRDHCQGDLVGFIDQLFAEIDRAKLADPITAKRDQLMAEFSRVHAVSAKLVAMMISELLMAGGPKRRDWAKVGWSMPVIDSLVHNFFHRTGILAAFDNAHLYGPACHGPRGCAHVIRQLADRIDARAINPKYPSNFPRFVEFAIWALCAEVRGNICNGRRIDDRLPCSLTDCPVGDQCSRIALRPASAASIPSSAEPTEPKFRGRFPATPQRKLTRRPQMHPLRQGHLDGLCGVYAVINAVRHAIGPHAVLSSDVWDDLFAELLSVLDRRRGTAATVTRGIGARSLRRLAKTAASRMATWHDIHFKISRPDHRGKARTVTKVLSYVSTAVEQPRTAVIIGLGGKLDHWSVVVSVGSKFITLFDSAGYHRVRVDRCTTRHQKAEPEGSHVIDARWLLQLRATVPKAKR